MPQPPQVDLFDPTFKANPYSTYAQLRSSTPIHRFTLPDGRGVWLVTRYEDVLAIFKDERIVKDWRKVLSPDQLAQSFSDPDELDIIRTDNRHLAFGKGIHHCLGAPLARMEGQIAIGKLLRRMPKLRLKDSPQLLGWRSGMVLRGLQGLPVEF